MINFIKEAIPDALKIGFVSGLFWAIINVAIPTFSLSSLSIAFGPFFAAFAIAFAITFVATIILKSILGIFNKYAPDKLKEMISAQSINQTKNTNEKFHSLVLSKNNPEIPSKSHQHNILKTPENNLFKFNTKIKSPDHLSEQADIINENLFSNIRSQTIKPK